MTPSERFPRRPTDHVLADAGRRAPVVIRRSWAGELAILNALLFRVVPVVVMALCPYLPNDAVIVYLFPIATALLVTGELSRLS